MKKSLSSSALAAIALSAAIALPSHAGEVPTPSSVNESAPDKAGKKGPSAGGTPTTPSKGPSSVSESAPQKTGKEPPAPMSKGDSKSMANPKTPSSVSESAPSKAAEANTKDKKGKKKEAEMNK